MNLALHMPHKTAARAAVTKEDGRSPLAPYFPEGGVAAPSQMVTNPVSHGPQSFPGNGSPNELAGPATAKWIRPRDSDDQGLGVPAFKAWPRQFHSEAYNFNSLDVMPLPDQVAAAPSELLAPNGQFSLDAVVMAGQRPVKAGWSVPKYSEQYNQPVGQYGLGDGVMNIADPRSMALALGWGYIG